MGKKKSIIASLAGQKAADFAINRAVDEQGNPTPAFQKAVLKALDVQRPLVLRNLNRLRRQNPQDTPAQLAERLGKQYLAAVTGGGAAVGGTAVIPGVGTAAALGLSAAATVGFLEATALYAQSVAELMGIPTDDPQRAQTLVMAVMLGDDGRRMLQDFTSQANGRGMGPLAGSLSVVTGSSGISEALFNQMKRMFIKRFIVRQGAGMLGRLVPFGVGAVVGGLGNRAMGKGVIKGAQNLFGPLPATIPGALASELTALPAGRKGRKDGREDDAPDGDVEAFGELLAEDIETDFEQLRDDGTLEDLRREDPEAFAAEVEAAREAHRRACEER
ncbi:MAG: hypothetical protein QJR09_04110 [Micrococcus sp.]|nr:hypothetical protein [Micrococcus sp.]